MYGAVETNGGVFVYRTNHPGRNIKDDGENIDFRIMTVTCFVNILSRTSNEGISPGLTGCKQENR
jgi:hypothetical protein